MDEDERGVADGAVAPCGHRNPRRAHFCDVCGVRLPVHCPRCHVINRRLAHFCNNCGLALRDEQGADATPSLAISSSAPVSAPEVESGSATVPIEPLVPETRGASDDRNGQEPSGPRGPWRAGRGRELIADEPEDAERLEQMRRFLQRRRRSRRAAGRLAIGGGLVVVLGFLGAAVVHTRIATPSAGPPRLGDTDAQASIAARADESWSALSRSTPANPGPPGTTVSTDHREGAPVFAA